VITPGSDRTGLVVDAELTERILNELNRRDDGRAVTAEAFDQQNANFTFDEQLARDILSAPPGAGLALDQLQRRDDLFAANNFDDGNAASNFIRRAGRSRGDGLRVSREPHEYAYCVSSGQFGRIFQLAYNWGELFSGGDLPEGHNYSQDYQDAVITAFDLVNENDVSRDGADYTYGNFVDMRGTRKAIARLRKIGRVVRSANTKQILQLLGFTQLQFQQQLEDRGRWLDVLEEMVNQNVQRSSFQGGTIPDPEQLDQTPNVND
jgi:hypothetical protein